MSTGIVIPLATTAVPPPPSPATPDDSSNGFLSGMSDLFNSIGSGVAAGIKASNVPTIPTAGSGWVYNPATGGYYNPLTGQQLTSTGTITSQGLTSGLTGLLGGSSAILVLLAVVLVFMFRKKSSGG